MDLPDWLHIVKIAVSDWLHIVEVPVSVYNRASSLVANLQSRSNGIKLQEGFLIDCKSLGYLWQTTIELRNWL